MANPANETVNYPFTAFSFSVEISKADDAALLCSAAFAECDGLEMTMDVKTIREGGANGRQHRLTGPMSFAQLTLKRGMTANFDLWDWVNGLIEDPSIRANAEVHQAYLGEDEHACGHLCLKSGASKRLTAPRKCCSGST